MVLLGERDRKKKPPATKNHLQAACFVPVFVAIFLLQRKMYLVGVVSFIFCFQEGEKKDLKLEINLNLFIRILKDFNYRQREYLLNI